MAPLQSDLELRDTLAAPRFAERHQRTVDRPIEPVWASCLAVTGEEIRLLGPLMALRGLPGRFTGGQSLRTSAPSPALDLFADAGFVFLRRDERPERGRALVLFGAVGRFWSPTANHPVELDGPDAFLAFDRPGYAKTTARLEAIDLGDGTTRIETETWVTGTDAASSRKFLPYWTLIRGPSGTIRRSWLAAIDRRAHLS